MEELPVEIGKLISLRYLDISHTRMECLPDSIGDLYHLQTLRATKEYGGEGCLRKLPDTFKLLTSLRHLYIPDIKLPPEIGKLIHIQTLPYFRVGDEDGCGIMELGSLNNLKGEIEIHNLEKVRDKNEAKYADLFHKPNIVKLMLVWNETREDDKSNDENVLEGLQPHRNLKILEIKGFKGNNFPLWTLRMEVREDPKDHWIRLDNLLEVELSDRKECEEIPMLGHLPRLKSLYLRRLFNVKSIGSSFYGIKDDEGNKETSIMFPALEKLELIDMKNLTSWIEVDFSSSCTSQPHEVFIFCRLEHLRITNCRQLKSVPSHFPCLKELVIDNMESGLPLASICGSQLTTLSLQRVDRLVCLPNELFNKNRDLIDLHIRYCNNLLYPIPRLGGSGASLRRLMIYKCQNLKELSEEVHKLNALEELIIWDCPNLKKLISPQGITSSLRRLLFLECSGLINFPCEILESCVLSLESLRINKLESLTNLEQVMSILQKMPRLTEFDIRGVPILPNVVVETGSLRNIAELYIGGCGGFVSMASVNRIFPAFQSLRELTLYGMEEWDSLPDQLQHLTTLQELSSRDFGIQMLPEWLEMLSSLTTLELWSCKQLRHLPSKKAMQGLANLTYLFINGCPLLKQDLELEASDDSEWSKLSHIPLIRVDGLTKFELQLSIRLGIRKIR